MMTVHCSNNNKKGQRCAINKSYTDTVKTVLVYSRILHVITLTVSRTVKHQTFVPGRFVHS